MIPNSTAMQGVWLPALAFLALLITGATAQAGSELSVGAVVATFADVQGQAQADPAQSLLTAVAARWTEFSNSYFTLNIGQVIALPDPLGFSTQAACDIKAWTAEAAAKAALQGYALSSSNAMPITRSAASTPLSSTWWCTSFRRRSRSRAAPVCTMASAPRARCGSSTTPRCSSPTTRPSGPTDSVRAHQITPPVRWAPSRHLSGFFRVVVWMRYLSHIDCLTSALWTSAA